jgi:hypothetical protein
VAEAHLVSDVLPARGDELLDRLHGGEALVEDPGDLAKVAIEMADTERDEQRRDVDGPSALCWP